MGILEPQEFKSLTEELDDLLKRGSPSLTLEVEEGTIESESDGQIATILKITETQELFGVARVKGMLKDEWAYFKKTRTKGGHPTYFMQTGEYREDGATSQQGIMLAKLSPKCQGEGFVFFVQSRIATILQTNNGSGTPIESTAQMMGEIEEFRRKMQKKFGFEARREPDMLGAIVGLIPNSSSSDIGEWIAVKTFGEPGIGAKRVRIVRGDYSQGTMEFTALTEFGPTNLISAKTLETWQRLKEAMCTGHAGRHKH